MMHSTRGRLRLAGGAALALAAATLAVFAVLGAGSHDALAGHGDAMARQHGKHQAEHFARLASALGLTEQQKAAARKLHDETSAKAAPLHERARLQHEEIQAMLESGSAEPSELGERMIELHATHRKLEALHEQMKTRLGAQLSAEQRAKLDKLHEEHAGSAGMHGLCKR